MVSIEELAALVSVMKIKEEKNDIDDILRKIKSCSTLVEKCVFIRYHIPPQSALIERIIRTDLKMNVAKDHISGDAIKNGIRYEIKYSGHSKKSCLNYVQIRPYHTIDYYIFIAYNIHSSTSSIGEAWIFKISAHDMLSLLCEYGGYAHGSKKTLGKITADSIKQNKYEYALRCDLTAKSGKSVNLWKQLMKYKTDYVSDNF